ncbi:hypothetical protein NDU88_003759 [Pleurodeles waltl]|uniref:Uncharacterized protein n=1 Tax=Pleurodeles waltl TaxID=8319 RepID=A0AAV7VF46_PLEWA|nr:hypothetical protein NDU88_003759 [Pleurodeles waltl]
MTDCASDQSFRVAKQTVWGSAVSMILEAWVCKTAIALDSFSLALCVAGYLGSASPDEEAVTKHQLAMGGETLSNGFHLETCCVACLGSDALTGPCVRATAGPGEEAPILGSVHWPSVVQSARDGVPWAQEDCCEKVHSSSSSELSQAPT